MLAANDVHPHVRKILETDLEGLKKDQESAKPSPATDVAAAQRRSKAIVAKEQHAVRIATKAQRKKEHATNAAERKKTFLDKITKAR